MSRKQDVKGRRTDVREINQGNAFMQVRTYIIYYYIIYDLVFGRWRSRGKKSDESTGIYTSKPVGGPC